jgi:zinc D-Ala-D-Ala carboxypeptidase
MNLSCHFTLEEMTFSQVAARLGLDNTPDSAAIANLERLTATVEAIRTLLGDKPIVVHSGYRSPQVNLAVGGVGISAHCRGLACDFTCPAFGAPVEAALAILRSDIAYDQLILEYGWVHIALEEEGSLCRREALTKRSPLAGYECGIRV